MKKVVEEAAVSKDQVVGIGFDATCSLVLVGHVTKEGNLAGPKVLEHMIDCFLMLDSAAGSRFRTLRSLKNRFGAVNELGVFAMTEQGMREVKNPSAIFLERPDLSLIHI